MSNALDYATRSLSKQFGAELQSALRRSEATIDAVAATLDRLTDEQRILAVRVLNGRDQARLWELSVGRGVTVDDMVPRELPEGQTVRHYGRNSLPAFTLFEKRFQRARGAEGEHQLWGYNFQKLAKLTGPGYYVAVRDPSHDTLGIDYRRLPPLAPAGWPPLRSNDVGLSKLVYAGMVDYLRKVTDEVTIGRVFKGGRWQNNYFVLCRESAERLRAASA